MARIQPLDQRRVFEHLRFYHVHVGDGPQNPVVDEIQGQQERQDRQEDEPRDGFFPQIVLAGGECRNGMNARAAITATVSRPSSTTIALSWSAEAWLCAGRQKPSRRLIAETTDSAKRIP